jgi:cyanophycin synthetase
VSQLVDAQINSDPRRGLTEDHPLNRLEPEDDGVILGDLKRQGLTPAAVPEAGRKVLIQRNGNVAIDCTDQVHPEVEHVVALAARIVGLDIAGVDLVAQDIAARCTSRAAPSSRSTPAPACSRHLKPASARRARWARAIVDALLPRRRRARSRAPTCTPAHPRRGHRRHARQHPPSRAWSRWLAHLLGQRVGPGLRRRPLLRPPLPGGG